MKAPQHYIDKHGQPLVRPSYCVFADLMGFTQQIRACKTSGATSALCKQVHKQFEQLSEHLGAQWNSTENTFTFQFVSDGVILGAPPDNLEDDEDLGFALEAVAWAQLDLVLAGFLLRGGMTFGLLHISERLVFGPSFLDAYEIERKRAKYPRIVVADTVLALAKMHAEYWGGAKNSPFRTTLWKNEGEIFLNYLDCTNAGDVCTDWDTLKKHRDFIESALKKHRRDKRVFPKYLWLRDYHNEFCRNHWWAESEEAKPTKQLLESVLVQPKAKSEHQFIPWRPRRVRA